jgi:hypothetical protein
MKKQQLYKILPTLLLFMKEVVNQEGLLRASHHQSLDLQMLQQSQMSKEKNLGLPRGNLSKLRCSYKRRNQIRYRFNNQTSLRVKVILF